MSPSDRRPQAPGEPLSRPARIAAAALGKRWKLPLATHEVRVLRGVDVPMRDGAALRADVYLRRRPAPTPPCCCAPRTAAARRTVFSAPAP